MKNDTLVTGGSGMVGSAIKKLLPDATFVSSRDCDLRDYTQVDRLFEKVRPKHVIHLAARVGGVKANQNMMGEFFFDNVMINTNVLHASYLHKTSKVLSLMSTCVYPVAECVNYPLTECQLYSGRAHSSNFAYAYTKRMLDVQSRAYRLQYGCNFITAIPNNLYGPHDNFDLENGHVVPAIIRKVYDAKINNIDLVNLWGDGSSLREFTYSVDAAKAILFLMENYNGSEPINIGSTQEVSIKRLAEIICEKLEYDGKIVWDESQPKGQHRKPSSNKSFIDLGWNQKSYLEVVDGIDLTCKWFQKNYPHVRGYK